MYITYVIYEKTPTIKNTNVNTHTHTVGHLHGYVYVYIYIYIHIYVAQTHQQINKLYTPTPIRLLHSANALPGRHIYIKRKSLHTVKLLPVLRLIMGCLRLVGSLKIQVSFAKEPCKRDCILPRRPRISRSLLIAATL